MYAVVAYVPALHRGYIDFFREYVGGDLYILGAEFLSEAPRLDRDIRALDPEEIMRLTESLDIFKNVSVLDESALEELKNAGGKIVMPDEDVSRDFAERHLVGLNVEFVPVFLRWDKQISTAELEVPPDRIVSEDELDKELMDKTEELAKKSPDWWRQIGAFLVKNGVVATQAYNRPLPSEHTFGVFGDPRSNFDAGERIDLSKIIHAEAGVIAEAARRGISTEGASLYVTTFPCPTCAKLVAEAGIKKVYYRKGYSLLDAEDVLRGEGVEIILVK